MSQKTIRNGSLILLLSFGVATLLSYILILGTTGLRGEPVPEGWFLLFEIPLLYVFFTLLFFGASLVAIYVGYDKRLGRFSKEQRPPTFLHSLIASLEKPIENITFLSQVATPEQERLWEIKQEVLQLFPDHHTYFSAAEYQRIAPMTIEERHQFYNDMRILFAGGTVKSAVSLEPQLPQDLQSLLTTVQGRAQCLDLEKEWEFRYRREFANDPKELERRLDMLHQTFATFRAERGW